MELETVRRQFLQALGGRGPALDEVMAYGASPYDLSALPRPLVLPLEDEAHVADWRRYQAEAEKADDLLGTLQERLPQLAVPIRAGISKSEAYRGISGFGDPFREEDFGGRLALERPGELRLEIHASFAGSLPVLITTHRPDFETLVRSLALRGEPEPVHPSVFAQTVSGLNNWDRVHRYQRDWEARHRGEGADWDDELQRVAREEPWRFRDRFLILCVGPYSGVTAARLGLGMDEPEWLERSLTLRMEHEFTHYATLRLFGRWSLSLLDETLCDWAGAVRALGCFEAGHFLRFLGLEDGHDVRPTGRMHEYRSQLSDEAFGLLARLTVPAAQGLEELTRLRWSPGQEQRFLLALTQLTLEQLACAERADHLDAALAEADRLLGER